MSAAQALPSFPIIKVKKAWRDVKHNLTKQPPSRDSVVSGFLAKGMLVENSFKKEMMSSHLVRPLGLNPYFHCKKQRMFRYISNNAA